MEVEYYKKDDKTLRIFIREIEKECTKEETMDIEKLETIMKRTADRKLK